MTRSSWRDPNLSVRCAKRLRAYDRWIDRRIVRERLGHHAGEIYNSTAWSRHRWVRFERDERRREADGLPSVRAWLRSYHGNDDLSPEVI